MSDSDRETRLAAVLADAAADLGGAVRLEDFLRIFNCALAPLPAFRLAALAMYDGRHGVLVASSVLRSDDEAIREGPIPLEGQEFVASQQEVKRWLDQPCVVEKASRPQSACVERILAAGCTSVVSAGMRSEDALAGVLFAGFETDIAEDSIAVFHCARLAQIVTPAFLNYRTRERFSRGDKRRTSLVELSHAINNSLRFGTAMSGALHAIRDIEGHTASIIGLVVDAPEKIEIYRLSKDGEGFENDSIPLGDSPFGDVLKDGQLYESGDLHDDANWPLDKQLAALGVRRYTVAPMFVRGRIIGGFLFGTADPHPALTTDVWMYENIALQLALAIDNARQFEALERMSDQLAQQNVYLREEIDTEHNVEGMIGRSDGIRRVFEQIVRVAETDSVVLVSGETGTGKELVARAIHGRSSRADQPLVKINCAAIPENLVESELFGHERGAFTSATSRRVGRFELAREGTLFLDEIGELPLAIQAKLLRVLQDGEFERVGGSQTISTNARIIAATNRDLATAAANGTFRSDLYYRLNVFPIHVPALGTRREDIPLLVESFISQFNRRMGKTVRAIDAESLDYLTARNWPGNIRELRHVIEHAMILCDGEQLVVPRGPETHEHSVGESARVQLDAVAQRLLEASNMEEVERLHIERVLRHTGGVIEGTEGAAARLGLKPSTLRSRMKRLRVSRQSSPRQG